MRRLVMALAAAAALAETGCFVRPWAIEESERIDRMMEYEVDDAEEEAFEGIAAPSGLSPGAVVEVERRSPAASWSEAPKPRSKKSMQQALKAEVAFSGDVRFSGLKSTRSSKRR